jgi:glycerate kinase
MKTSTFGTGELIRLALDQGVDHLLVGIGGSATNDGGTGMAAALGVRFLDASGREIEPVGGQLHQIHKIEASNRDPRLDQVTVEVVCDVDNPLLGPNGAARIYGPQKGATPEQVEQLEQGLANLADRIEADLGLDVRPLAGGGAAGGLGAGLFAFAGASLRRGVEVMLELVDMEAKLDRADLVLTAEGQLDAQIAFGKGPAGVAQAAKRQGIPCLALAGSVTPELPDIQALGLTAALSICPGPLSLDQALAQTADNLRRASEQVVRIFLACPSRDAASRH